MSKYTTEVRFICETYAGLTESEGYNSINEIIGKSMDKVFDFDYPIFDNAYKNVLQRKILKHYYTREIGLETVGLWKHFLDMRMNEIMPYYNKLYETELLKFNPLYDVDLTKEHSGTGTETGVETSRKNDTTSTTSTIKGNKSIVGEGENVKEIEYEDNSTTSETGTIEDEGGKTSTKTLNTTTTSTDSGTDTKTGSDVKKNNRWDIYSDTPQGSLQNIKTGDGAYLTNARNITDDGTGSTFSETINHGKINTTRETGTVSDSETNENTRTLGTTTTVAGTKEGTESTTDHNETTENSTENGSINGTGNSTQNTDHNINTTNDYIEHVSGKTPGASFARLLMEYRDALLNIDMMIIQELADLFMNLW